jgi:uncharacterized membrane protein YdbT with pleckstrin-like domain
MEGTFSREKLIQIKDQEGITKIIHRHWFDITKQFLVVFLMLFFMAVSFYLLPLFTSFFSEGENIRFFIFMESFFAIFVWIYSFFIWIDYYFDIWVITSERVINIEQKGLFIRCLSELKLDRIQDVTVEVTGIFATILNFGDVFIQTAGEKERFVFRQVPDPYAIKDMIMSLQKKIIAEETNELGEVIRKEIHKEIA